MKLSKMRVNSAAMEVGRWVPLGKTFPGVEVKVRGVKSKGYKRELHRYVSDLPLAERLKIGDDMDAAERVDIQMTAGYLLVDWRGIEDENDQPVPFSKEKATELLSDPDMIEFREAVDYAVKIVGNDALVEAETASKN